MGEMDRVTDLEGSDQGDGKDDAARRAANRKLLESVVALYGTPRASELANFYTSDWVLELPFGDPSVRLEGASEIGAYLAPKFGIFQFTLRLNAIHDCLDPDLLVAEYESDGLATPTGRPYHNTYVALWRFRDGKVCGVKEYANPAVVAEALMMPTEEEE